MLKAGGASLDSLAKRFKVGRDAIHRHWRDHVTPEARAGYLAGPDNLDALRDKAAAEADSVLDYLRIVRTSLLSSLMVCSEAGDARGVALVAGTLTGTLEKIGKLTGQISAITSQTNVAIQIVNSPEWAQVAADMMRALAPYPAARSAVAAVLRAREAGADPATLPASRLPPCPVSVPVTIETTATHVK